MQTCLVVLLLSIGLAGDEARAEQDSLSETWYLLRGRANMKIANYDAAIEAFQKAVELDPDNREAMRGLGIAYEKQGLTDKAIGQFDRYLERFGDDAEIAFRQAEYLSWDRYAYRRDDAIRYFRMGLALRDDPAQRHALARLLGRDRSRLDEALEQYRILLETQPGNATWRAEYRDLLLWDPKHLAEAVREHRRLERERPDDFELRHTLARLIARQDPRGDEAVSRYAELVELRPADTALRHEYAQVLARHPGRYEAALAQYQRLLAKDPDFETRVEHADLLSSRPGNRDRALQRYEELLRERPGDTALRLRYARLLGAEREDTERAIAQYELVLEREPHNPAAHEGLAAAWAWLGERDRALAHADQALRYGARKVDVRDLRDRLREGREPRLEPELHGLVQRGRSKSELNGLGLGLRGRLDPSPFTTFRAELGFEDYWRKGDNTAGAYLGGGGEFRPDARQELDFELGYHSLGESAKQNVVGRAAYARRGESFDLGLAFARTLRHDSYLALVGGESPEGRIGAARENRFEVDLVADRERVELHLSPYSGWVKARGAGANPFVGVRGGLELPLYESERWQLASTLDLEMLHYRDDAFAVTAPAPTLPGGYFSPEFFLEALPGISATLHWGERSFLSLDGGPAMQVVDESGSSAGLEAGGRAELSYLVFLRSSLVWSFDASFLRISDAYTRLDWRTALTFLF